MMQIDENSLRLTSDGHRGTFWTLLVPLSYTIIHCARPCKSLVGIPRRSSRPPVSVPADKHRAVI